jgi:hypothetical protein
MVSSRQPRRAEPVHRRATPAARRLLAGVLVLHLGACAGPSAGERCAAAADAARAAAMAHFDATDPGLVHYADLVNRPDRRLEVGRLAYEHTLTGCLE